MTVRILQGDCRAVMAMLPAASVHCCVTSPPYWGLRDYGCEGQIGMEDSIDAWVAEIVDVMRGVRRVLRDDGTLWLNLGDSYAGSWGAQSREHAGKHAPNVSALSANQVVASQRRMSGTGSIPAGATYKAKDLIGQPWLVAFALRADGWYLRQEIIWHKPNPMPESIRDRCTKAHEQIFLLSKRPTYYYDFDAMQEPVNGGANARRAITPAGWATGAGPHTAVAHSTAANHRKAAVGRRDGPPGNPREKNNDSFNEAMAVMPDTRNKRSVWTVASEPFKEAHFATFPPALIEPCIRAGCPIGGTVLDPFGGAGTTGLVADRLQRHAVLIELNPTYAGIAERRITGDAPLFAEVSAWV